MKKIHRVIRDREGYRQSVIFQVADGKVIGIVVYDRVTGTNVWRIIGQMGGTAPRIVIGRFVEAERLRPSTSGRGGQYA